MCRAIITEAISTVKPGGWKGCECVHPPVNLCQISAPVHAAGMVSYSQKPGSEALPASIGHRLSRLQEDGGPQVSYRYVAVFPAGQKAPCWPLGRHYNPYLPRPAYLCASDDAAEAFCAWRAYAFGEFLLSLNLKLPCLSCHMTDRQSIFISWNRPGLKVLYRRCVREIAKPCWLKNLLCVGPLTILPRTGKVLQIDKNYLFCCPASVSIGFIAAPSLTDRNVPEAGKGIVLWNLRVKRCPLIIVIKRTGLWYLIKKQACWKK